MNQIVSWSIRYRWLTIGVWIIILAAALLQMGPSIERYSQGFTIPTSKAYQTNEQIRKQFGTGGLGHPVVAVVTVPPGETVDSSSILHEWETAVNQLAHSIPGTRIASFVSNPNADLISKDRRTTFALLYPPVDEKGHTPEASLQTIQEKAAHLSVHQAPIFITGVDALNRAGAQSSHGLNTGQELLIGGIGALIVLMIAFRSLTALLPILIAAISIPTTFALIGQVARFTQVSYIVEFFVGLIGLGIAIDYALLVVSRWRVERESMDNHNAVLEAMRTAGHSVMYSGLIVAVGLLGLIIVPVPMLRSGGYAGVLIPLMTIVVVVTLLPALLATIGPALDKVRLWPVHYRKKESIWGKWAQFVVRKRVAALVTGIVILLGLLAPVMGIRLGDPLVTSIRSSGTAHEGLKQLEQADIGHGVLTPFESVVRRDDLTALNNELSTLKGVFTLYTSNDKEWNQDGDALVDIIPEQDANSASGREVLQHLKERNVSVGSLAAQDADFAEVLNQTLPYSLALVLVVSLIPLMLAFRSLVIPLQAMLLNAVSLAATLGVMVMVWQKGWGAQFWGVSPTGSISFYVPFVVFAFLFGMSMDYEVFILSRVKEAYDTGKDTDTAIIEGIEQTGRLISQAALILIIAFVSLSLTSAVDVKIFASGMAIGILVDATLVRMLLVPALMSLIGKLNWSAPKWLARRHS